MKDDLPLKLKAGETREHRREHSYNRNGRLKLVRRMTQDHMTGSRRQINKSDHDIMWLYTSCKPHNKFICLLDRAYEAPFANIKMECQRWPKMPLVLGRSGTQYVIMVTNLLSSYCGAHLVESYCKE